MAAGHTGEMRPGSGNIAVNAVIALDPVKIKHQKAKFLIGYLKKHPKYFLHPRKTADIKSIVKTNVSSTKQRLCSTTFYQ